MSRSNGLNHKPVLSRYYAPPVPLVPTPSRPAQQQKGNVTAISLYPALHTTASRNKLESLETLTKSPLRLSRRYEKVLMLLTEGLTNNEIATHLGLTRYTVSNYVRTLYDITGLSSRVSLALFGVRREEEQDMRSSK